MKIYPIHLQQNNRTSNFRGIVADSVPVYLDILSGYDKNFNQKTLSNILNTINDKSKLLNKDSVFLVDFKYAEDFFKQPFINKGTDPTVSGTFSVLNHKFKQIVDVAEIFFQPKDGKRKYISSKDLAEKISSFNPRLVEEDLFKKSLDDFLDSEKKFAFDKDFLKKSFSKLVEYNNEINQTPLPKYLELLDKYSSKTV